MNRCLVGDELGVSLAASLVGKACRLRVTLRRVKVNDSTALVV